MKILRAVCYGWVIHAPYMIYEMCFDIYTDGVVRYSEEVEDYDESKGLKRRTRRRRWKMPQDVFERLTYLLSYGIYDIGVSWKDEHYRWDLETFDEKGKKKARHSGMVEEDWEKVLNTLVDTANAKLKPKEFANRKPNDYLPYCRYLYMKNGRLSCRDRRKDWYAGYEQKFCEWMAEGYGFQMELAEMKRLGLQDFNKDDGVPIQLKAILLNRWGHWCGGWGDESDRKGFIDFYLNDYMQGPRRKKHYKTTGEERDKQER